MRVTLGTRLSSPPTSVVAGAYSAATSHVNLLSAGSRGGTDERVWTGLLADGEFILVDVGRTREDRSAAFTRDRW